MDLSFNKLGPSSLPAEWGALQHLQEVHLQHNAISGEPSNASVGRLSRGSWVGFLTLLYYDARLPATAGALPAAWAGMSSLNTLDASSNALRGSLPPAWARMPLLARINLAGNTLSQRLPDEWSGLSALVQL